jgi:hypothetical protein
MIYQLSARYAAASLVILIALCGCSTGSTPAIVAAPIPKEKTMFGLAVSRAPASHVPPIVVGGVRYEPTSQTTIPASDHVPGVLGAYNAEIGAKLWSVKVADQAIEERLETDVQEDYITTLVAAPDGKLHVTTETGRKYEVDPATRTARVLQ